MARAKNRMSWFDLSSLALAVAGVLAVAAPAVNATTYYEDVGTANFFGTIQSYPPFSWDYVYTEGVNFSNWSLRQNDPGTEGISTANYPNNPGDDAFIDDWCNNSYNNTSGELDIVTNHSITIGGLELDVDDSTMWYVLAVDQSGSQFFQFDNSPNNADAYLKVGAVNGAVDRGLDGVTAPIRLLSNLDVSGTSVYFSGGISGAGGIVADVSGTLQLYAGAVVPANTFAGGVTINSGTVQINDDSNLGAASSTLTFNGGTLSVTQNITGTRPINLQSNGVFAAKPSVSLIETGVISGARGLILAGEGTYQFGSSNSYQGDTVLQGDETGGTAITLKISSDNSLGNGGRIFWNGPGSNAPVMEATGNLSTNRQVFFETPAVIQVDSGVTFTMSGPIGGPSSLTVQGAGTLALGGANSWGGTTTLSGGTLSINGSGELGAGSITFSGGTLAATGNAAVGEDVNGSSAALFNVSSGVTLSLSGAISSAGITKSGPGTLVLSANSGYGSQTTLNGGALQFASDRFLGATATPIVFAGGTLEATAGNNISRAFTGSGSNPINVTVDSGTLTNSGLVGGTGNSSALIVGGLGTLTLSDASNNYAGGTTINGTLGVSADGDLGTSGTSITFGQIFNHLPIPGTLITTGNFSTSRSITLGTVGGQFNPASGTTLTITSAIGGGSSSGGLVMNGPGTLAINTAGTWSGGTTLNGGTLVPNSIAITNSLGALALDGGTLTLQQPSTGIFPAILPMSLGGFNFDVVVDHAATPSNFRTFINRGFDNPNVNSGGTTFLESGYNGTSPTGNAGLPQSHTFTSAADGGFGSFTLASYNANNALILSSNGGTGTLSLASPASYSLVALLDAAANGGSNMNVVLDFSDGTTAAATSVSVPDWFSGSSGAAYTASARVALNDGSVQTSSGGPNLYEQDISVPSADLGKLLSGVTFTNTGTVVGQTIGVFAMSGYSPTQTYTNTLNVTANSVLNITGAPVISFGNLTLSSGKLSFTTTDAHLLLETTGITAGLGAIDLSFNDMVVHSGSLSAITSLLKSGFNGGAWNGAGIVSSAAAATRGTQLAIVLNTNGTSPLLSSFDGQSVSTTDVLIKYTWLGDTNLDGIVNATDLSNLNARIGWDDFNYDSKVNADDYALFQLGAAESGGANVSATLPEPIAIAILAPLLLFRRRR